MPLLDRVRAIRADENHLEPENLASARQSLENEISSPQHATQTRRRALRWGLGLGGAGIATAGTFAVLAIVGGSVVAPLSDQPASASEILEQAAAATLDEISAADQPLAPGQYLRIDRVEETLYTGPEIPVCAAFTAHVKSSMYIPADRNDDWVIDRGELIVTDVIGSGGQELVDWTTKWEIRTEAETIAYPGGTGWDNNFVVLGELLERLDSMPRDPVELLDYINNLLAEASVPQDERTATATREILSLLEWNLPPADLRAAMLNALSISNQFEVASISDEIATLVRVADSQGGSGETVTVDMTTGNIISVSYPQVSFDPLLSSTINQYTTTYSATVVDEAPAVTGPDWASQRTLIVTRAGGFC